MKPDPEFGDIFYSEYFECRCIVLRYEDENNWWFYPEGYSSKYVLKAKAKPHEVKWLTRVK